MSGTAVADGRPSGLFVAHAAAITEVYLAMVEHGPATGITVTGWLTDRAGWQEWTRTGRWSSHPSRLTPDAVASLAVDGGEAVAFVEVDLASMTQTLLRQKVARYLAYADDLAWQGRHPYCPPMLLLTTTQTRAVGFLKAAGQVMSKHRGTTDPKDAAAVLVVAACGLVRDPGTAINEVRWVLADDSTADLTLAEILAERAVAKVASDAWLHERDVVQRRRDDLRALRSLADSSAAADWLGSKPAAEVLHLLIGGGPDGFMAREPDLAEQITAWCQQWWRVGRFTARDRARPFVAELEQRHRGLWEQQARRLLAARADIADDHPWLYRLAATLADGHLSTVEALAILDQPAQLPRAELQRAILGEHHAIRAATVDEHWASLPRREQRHISREQLAADYDERNLAQCNRCALVYPPPSEGGPGGVTCPHCAGTIVDGLSRASIVTLAQRLKEVETMLT